MYNGYFPVTSGLIMGVGERNEVVNRYMNAFMLDAIKSTPQFDGDTASVPIDLCPELVKRIGRIIEEDKAWGIRELLVTCCVGFILDRLGYIKQYKFENIKNFQPTVAFYDMTPRSVYAAIRGILQSKKIPHRKDGPLNMAKGITGLDKTWADSRKGPARAAANDLVYLLNQMEQDSSLVDSIFTVTMQGMLKLASNARELKVKHKTGISDEIIFRSLSMIIHEATDRGNTPHNLISILFSEAVLFWSNGSLSVLGAGESANATDTTSKKPGDFAVADDEGKIIQIVEVTLKVFGNQRISDSINSLRDYESNGGELENAEVIVLCREEDTPNKRFEAFNSEGVTFHFMSIDKWIISKLIDIGRKNRLSVFEKFTDYVNDHRTNNSVKESWRALTSD